MRRQAAVPAAVTLLALGLVGCGQSGNPTPAGPTPNPAASGPGSPTDVAAVAPAVAADYSHAVFTKRSANVDNRWMGFQVGRLWEMRGSAIDGDQRISRRVVATVTDLTKVVDGVRTAVLYEEDFDQGELVEAEISFFAQDTAGNVWHLGEYPEEYDNGKFVKAPAWIAGLAGATAGVMMRAEPRTGTTSYAEGYAPPPLNWDDHARVYRTGERVCVSTGCYRNVAEIQEFEPDIPKAFQHKFYAPGLGGIKVGWSGANEPDHEVLRLVRVRQLSDAQQARMRQRALALQASAYRHSHDVYGQTEPAR